MRAKAVFVGAVAFLLAPLVATLPGARCRLGFSALLGRAGRGAGLWPHAHAAERNAALCRSDCRPAVQLLAGQPSRPGFDHPDASDGRAVSVDGHPGGDRRRPGPHHARLAGAQLSRRAAWRLRRCPVQRPGHRARRRRYLSGRGRAGRARPGRDPAGRDRGLPARQAQPAITGNEPDRASENPYRLSYPYRLPRPLAALHRGALRRPARPGRAADCRSRPGRGLGG